MAHPPITPFDALTRWPVDQPLGVRWSSHEGATLLARPSATHVLPASATLADAQRYFASLGWQSPLRDHAASPRDIPALTWLSYDLGRLLEPAAQHAGFPRARADRDWPLAITHTCDAALRFASPASEPEPLGAPVTLAPPALRPFRVGEPRSDAGQSAYEASVARGLDAIRAGDVYQVNLAHRLSAPFQGCPRSFFAALLSGASPWHGFYSELVSGDRAWIIASASPELFLDVTPERMLTRPMKGTRPASSTSRHDLATSAKDQAELAMIVDLMRNDLGRVAQLASVRVVTPRELELHGAGDHGHDEAGGGLLQATATIAAQPRDGASLAEILHATFPPGSVTGAPKIRAMQLIDELEPSRRGAYCGISGLVTPGSASLGVNIRTACITGRATRRDGALTLMDATLDWWVGAGIVAESVPRDEWHETLHKARSLHAALARASSTA